MFLRFGWNDNSYGNLALVLKRLSSLTLPYLCFFHHFIYYVALLFLVVTLLPLMTLCNTEWLTPSSRFFPFNFRKPSKYTSLWYNVEVCTVPCVLIYLSYWISIWPRTICSWPSAPQILSHYSIHAKHSNSLLYEWINDCSLWKILKGKKIRQTLCYSVTGYNFYSCFIKICVIFVLFINKDKIFIFKIFQ